ncbi:hypothetical protein MHC_04090 [Mycoplasma haemocanis str. Illinois]|uniref:Uncharacterized protein n=1 Tax=Mycoplasma haemocanis (strain Illinois) TaxID=1111676 RepID=H6N7Q2_MYCHN|nr:hypothetical protein [Mycoplasma haemocanis]AEW45674.1 hypothetical protein MHC_04090 [Mycoplasma haemocanis str. Illinois]
MNTLIPKVVAAVVSFGGAIAVLSETKGSDNQEDLLSQNTSLAEKPKKKIPNKNNCNVYSSEYTNVLNDHTKTFTRKLEKIQEQFWTKDEFLQEVKNRGLWNGQDLENKINDACSKKGKRAFVWWGIADNQREKTWVFDDNINRENWLDKDIPIPEYWPEEIKTE